MSSSSIPISRFFAENLGAPFRNTRWSWGATDKVRKRLFLRLWSDDRDTALARVRVLEKYLTHDNRPGLHERRQHLELIRTGQYTAFGVLCDRDRPGGPIRDFNSRIVLRLGALVDDEDFVYATVLGHILVTGLEEAR